MPSTSAKSSGLIVNKNMCNQCIKEAFPERDTTCLDNGSYFLNFLKCSECERKDALKIQNWKQNEDEDGEELVTYQHICTQCGHTVANHEYRFKLEDDFQVYEMECLLCGRGEDERSINPVDPRQQPFFY